MEPNFSQEYLDFIAKRPPVDDYKARIDIFERTFGMGYKRGIMFVAIVGDTKYVAVVGALGDFAVYSGKATIPSDIIARKGSKEHGSLPFAIFTYLFMLEYRR